MNKNGPQATIRMREWRKLHPNENSDTRWRRQGFINPDGSVFTTVDRDRLYQQQQGRCANKVCNIHESDLNRVLEADHSHLTGIVRGLLCGPCNRALGDMHDDPTLLHGLIAYLKRVK